MSSLRTSVARALLCSLACSGAALAQGTIAGRVTAQESGQPLQEARVILLGTSLFTTTNADGRYSIRNAPSGGAEVRVIRVGYSEQKRPVTVATGQTTTLDFALTPVVVKLSEVVTTATGETRRLELGNNIAQVNAAELTRTAPIATVSDLLTARAPGVQVMPGTTTGASSRIRIRGFSSLSLSNDPIYIVDGIRITSGSTQSTGQTATGGAIGVGGTTFSRLGDINPQDIDNIEIVKGPSAATLYGTDAANGVVVITTKRGRAGRTRWNVFAENGIVTDHNTYPTAYTLFGTVKSGPTAGTKRQCFISEVGAGLCTADSLLSYNLWSDPNASPLGTGQRQEYGLSVSGGSEGLSFFASGNYEKELGVYTIPPFDRTRLETAGINIRQEWLRPNGLEKQNFRVNLTSTVSPKLDLQWSAGFIHLNQRLPQIDNNTTGLGSSAFGGPGYADNGSGLHGEATGQIKYGYRAFTPGDIFQETVNQQANRFIGSFNANYRPFSWMANRGNVGVDYLSRVDSDLCRFGQCSDFGTNRQGFATNSRGQIRNFSADLSSSATFNPRPYLNSRTTFGAQYINYDIDQNRVDVSQLPPGTQTITAGAVVTSALEATGLQKTLGLFVEQALAVRDRLFLTAALRTDQNSAFGTNFQQVYYPKLSASYVISDEEFFPKIPALSQLRLRATYGAAGTQPGPNDALRFLTPTTVNVDRADQPGVILGGTLLATGVNSIGGVGNPDLKPERATEFETGFDAKMLDSRINLELTYYSKLTKDALIQRVLPPSAGVATARFENLGSVKNAGLEALINAQLVQNNRFGWDMTLAGSTNANKLVSMGIVPNIVGTLIQERAGYPLFGYWQRPITGYQDKNGDGILTYNADPTLNEVFVGDTAVYRGYSNPRHEVTWNNGFDFLNRTLRIATLFDYKGGYLGDNDTQRIRCQNRLNCREEADPTAPLGLQARVVALRDHPARTQDGFLEDGSFVRFRELSVTYSAPPALASRFFRSESASLTFAARNLHVWTKYTGVDPESSYFSPAGTADAPNDFQTAAPPTYFTLRFNLGF